MLNWKRVAAIHCNSDRILRLDLNSKYSYVRLKHAYSATKVITFPSGDLMKADNINSMQH
jgi:hypothetical protein